MKKDFWKNLVFVVVASSWLSRTLVHQHHLSHFIAFHKQVVDLHQNFFFLFVLKSTIKMHPFALLVGEVDVKSATFAFDTIFFQGKTQRVINSRQFHSTLIWIKYSCFFTLVFFDRLNVMFEGIFCVSSQICKALASAPLFATVFGFRELFDDKI